MRGGSLQTLEDLERELKLSVYKESYYAFFVDAFKVLNPTDDYSDNWHIKYICDQLQEVAERIRDKKENPEDIIINVPFRSSKSLICTVCFPVWSWLIKGDMKFICTSYGADLALEHAQLSRNLMESEWFQSIFPIKLKRDENSKSFYVNTKGGFRKSVGMGGAITGSGADIIICLRGDQKIKTDKGDIEIQKIVEGKMPVKVLSYNHKKQKSEYKRIKRYDKNPGKQLLKIKTRDGKELICTENHEVWTENRGYVEACNLKPNDIVRGE